MLTTLFFAGLLFDLLGVALIALDLVGLRRVQRFGEGLRLYLHHAATPRITPARIFQTFMELFYNRRWAFWFLVLAPIPMLPSFAQWVTTRFPVVQAYVALLQTLWLLVGGTTVILLALAGAVRLAAPGRDRFPFWIDHLITLAAVPWRISLLATVPAALLFIAFPIAANFICVNVILYALFAVTAFASRVPLRQPRRALRLVGIVLISLGFALQIYAAR